MKNPDAALVLAAARASGALPPDRLPASLVAQADEVAHVAGRSLVECNCPWPVPAGAVGPPGPPGRALVLGWSETPVPEELGTYPVTRLTPTQTITFALCLAQAWPDPSMPLYPGRPFERAEILDMAGDIGLDVNFAKAALDGELQWLLLIVREGRRLRLGPAVAALPDTFAETMRRFHDLLPGPDVAPPTWEDEEAPPMWEDEDTLPAWEAEDAPPMWEDENE
ncbi:hypothetical protein ACWGQ5_39870 [Streptomyces sp. NPDC055722]